MNVKKAETMCKNNEILQGKIIKEEKKYVRSVKWEYENQC